MRRLSMSLFRAVILLIVAIVATATLNAQSSVGALRGVVKDAQGVIPGANVKLTNEANGTSRETVSNEVGEYSFPGVQPGSYTLTVSMASYGKYERKGMRIGTQDNLSIDVSLEVGGIQETVAVTAQAPLLETTNASTGATLDNKELEAIPSAGRSIFLMANLQPTVQTTGNAHWNRMQDQNGNSTMSMGGGPVQANNYLVDGFPVTDLQNRASTNPSIEAVEDMKVQVHTYDAETGRTGGGVMNMSAKSGANQFHGGIYGVYRPTSMVGELLIPKVSGLPNTPEVWRDGGGGFGGPIFKNKTFFWIASESYVDQQPQSASMLVPTAAEIGGNFNGVLKSGKQITITDPLTGLAFPGNVIPANRINPVDAMLLRYYQPATTQIDNGSPNLVETDLLPNRAFQGTVKIDQHFNNAVSLSGFVLRQVTHEANTNYNPAFDFVGSSYQLDRTINTMVLNNTYVVNPSTVLMVRGGYNHFDDNDYLNDRNGSPLAFNVSQISDSAFAGGWPQAFLAAMPDTQRYPNISMTGYKGTGWTARQENGYYQYGANAALTKLAGDHSLKFGADWRTLGVASTNFGSSTGSYSFTGTYTGSPVADMLLGYPASGSLPLNSHENGYVNYYSAFAQDDWRRGRLTVNYGVRLEHETGLAEKNNQISVTFDQTAVNPLNKDLTFTDPVTGQPRSILGGLVFAGVNGAPTAQGNQPGVKVAPRLGAVYSFNDKTVLRGGWGLYYVPYSYSSAGTTSWGQIGYSATTNIQQTSPVPTVTMSNPFPGGLVQPTGNSLGLLTGEGGDITFVDPNKGAPRVYQYSMDLQRELPAGVTASIGYTGLTGRNLSWSGSININQLDPKYLTSGINTLAFVTNPFYGIADAGQYAASKTIQLGQLLRPFPEFGNITMSQGTGAKSQYNALIVSLRKRSSGLWGGSFSYTYSRLNDNQFGQGNYYSSGAGLQNNYEVIPGSAYYNPDDLYGRSLLDSPHKIVIAPTVNLPFGEGRRWLNHGGLMASLIGGWSVNVSTTLQSGFPIGVTQQVTTTGGNSFLFGGTVRPDIVPGVPFILPDITSRITNSVTDNQYLNPAAFTASAANSLGNEPRLLPGAYSPWRDNTDLGVNKSVGLPGNTHAQIRLEVLNLFNEVQWAAPSTSFGSSTFGQISSQANNARMLQFTLRYQF
jgi:trimeric autotransporter adhesin